MNVGAVNSVSFAGAKVTDKGNEYQTSNIGKLGGAGLTTLVAGYKFYSMNKNFNSDEFKTRLKEIHNNIGVKDIVSFDEYLNNVKKTTRTMGVVLTVLGAGLFIGLGAVVDNYLNGKRADDADLAAARAKKEEEKA